jgi:hypothetical protein
MIQIETLERKQEFVKKDGTVIIDLTQSSVEYKSDVRTKTYVMVTSELAMRPDLISEIVYGNPNRFDYILKFNGISNPLSIYTGQVLYIPEEDDMSACFKTPRKETKDTENKKAVAIKPKTKKDEKRLDILRKKAGRDNLLPPNINAPNEENIVFDGDKILLGASATNVSPECPENLTRARLKQKLLNKKIFG